MEPRKRILIVDDEASNRELLEALLSSLGHDVDIADNGFMALRKLDGSHDLVLLDVMMPGIDGFEVVRRNRSESASPDVPICLVTALSGKEERLRAVEAGANDFIGKPIDKTELRVRTDSLLKMKAAQDTIGQYQARLEAQNASLQESVEQLEKLSATKDEFIAIASHDLKNPLTGILGLAFIIAHQAPPGAVMTQETCGHIAKISRQCRVMQKIIEDFLDFQALEDGQIKLALGPLDLNELGREVLERNAVHAQEKRIGLRSEWAPEMPLLNGDKSRIGQVLDNFVNNAIKFSPPGAEVIVRTSKTENDLILEVIDSGPGLRNEDMKKLFVKYARLSNKPTGGEKSTSLGLAICKRIVDLQGGTTGARNNPVEGSTFWLSLPASMAIPSSETQQATMA